MLKEQRKVELLKEQWKDIMSNVKGVMSQVAEKDLDQSHDENLPVPSGTKGYHGRNEEAGAQPGINRQLESSGNIR